MKISVYQTFNGYRVVAGDHRPANKHLNIRPRVYATADEAYRMETDDSIRASIRRIESSIAEESTPATQHHVVKVGSKVRIDKVTFQSNQEYVGKIGFVTAIYPINGRISVGLRNPYNRTVSCSKVSPVPEQVQE